MEKYEMTGIVESVGPVQVIGQSKFRKREVVLCDDPNDEHPHRLVWELTGDKVSLVNEAHIGREVKIAGWPESRSWKDKQGNVRWFTSMKAYSATVSAAVEPVPQPAGDYPDEADGGEEMPF